MSDPAGLFIVKDTIFLNNLEHIWGAGIILEQRGGRRQGPAEGGARGFQQAVGVAEREERALDVVTLGALQSDGIVSAVFDRVERLVWRVEVLEDDQVKQGRQVNPLDDQFLASPGPFRGPARWHLAVAGGPNIVENIGAGGDPARDGQCAVQR